MQLSLENGGWRLLETETWKKKESFFFLAPRLGFDFFDFDEAGPPQICGLCSVRFASANERTALSRRRQSDLNGVGSAFCYFFLRKRRSCRRRPRGRDLSISSFIPGFTRFYLVFFSFWLSIHFFISFRYQTRVGFTISGIEPQSIRFQWVLLGFIGFYWVLLSFT